MLVVSRSRRAQRTFNAIGVLSEVPLWAFFLVAIVWWVTELQLSALQLILIGTTLEVSALLSEVPTGVIADRFSRSGSVLLSFLLMGGGLVLHGATTMYGLLLVSQVLIGVGWTFRSGADVAWFTDQFPESEESDKVVGKLIIRRQLLVLLVTAATVPFVVLLGQWSLRGTLVVVGLVVLIGGFVVARLLSNEPEPLAPAASSQAEPEAGPTTVAAIFRQGRLVAAKQPIIRRILGVVFVLGLGEEAIDRLGYERFLVRGNFADDSLAFTGALFVVVALTGAGATRLIEHRIEKGAPASSLAMWLILMAVAGVVLVAFSPILGIAIGLTLQDAARETLYGVFTSWANPLIDQQSRATVHSILSLAGGLGVAIGGLCAAFIAWLGGVSPALLWSAAVFLLAAAVAATTGRLRAPV